MMPNTFGINRMKKLMGNRFFKYQALGNDMIVIDPTQFTTPLTPIIIRQICDRHFGPGADGVCYGPLPGEDLSFTMRFFNPDGSEAEKSGNGLRIFARYVWDAGYAARSPFTINIQGSLITATIEDEWAQHIGLKMGRLSFLSDEIPMAGPPREVVEEDQTFRDTSVKITGVNIGNPHCVIFTEHSLVKMARELGPHIETDHLFPNRTNVQFARVVDQHTLRIEIWERGAGYTLASGTSATAAAGAAVKTNRCCTPVTVQMQGGEAVVEIDPTWHTTLTGSVAGVYHGEFTTDWLESINQA
jgi:diaminopimelate epimerase